MDWLTGLACLLPLGLPVAIGLGVWAGLKQRGRAEAGRDALSERIALGGFTPVEPEPWLAGHAQGRPVRIKAMVSASYRASSSDAPASVRLGQKLVAVMPLDLQPFGGTLRRTRLSPHGREFSKVWEGIPHGLQPGPELRAFLMDLANNSPELRFSLGSTDDRAMYAQGLFPDAPCVLRAESPPIDHLPTLHQWLADLAELAGRTENTVS
ncbi:MAG: hypothetical protein VX899_06380 [Myxococcota bacterium]|nr:hypothetical protein [Myxococcota bacterium]